MSIPTTPLAGYQVGRVGHGLMQLTWGGETVAEEKSFESMKWVGDFILIHLALGQGLLVPGGP